MGVPRTIGLGVNGRGAFHGAAIWEALSTATPLSWEIRRGGLGRVTENERRAADSLRASDLVIRGLGAVGLIAVALVLLLVLNPT